MSKSHSRLTRVNELMKREIAFCILTRMGDALPNPASVTVTRVEVSSDLRHANVQVSIMGSPEEQQDVLRRLGHHRQEIQQHLNKTVRLKYMPRLHFHLDTSLEEGDRVLSLLYQLEQEQNQNQEPYEPN